MQLDLNSGILLIGMVQGLFLTISLSLHKSGPKIANRFLSSLLFSFVLALFVHFLNITDLWKNWIYPYIILSSIVFLFGPLLYLYVKQLTTPEPNLSASNLLHLLPLAANIALFIPLLLLPSEEIVAGLSKAQTSERAGLLLPILKVASVTIYTLWSLWLWLNHSKRIRQHYSDLDKKSLTWLRNLLLGFFSFELIFIVVIVFQFDLSSVPGEIDTILSVILIGLIFMTGFYGLQQPEIFRGESSLVEYQGSDGPENLSNIEDNSTQNSKYQSSNLTDALKHKISASLEKLVMQQKLYLERFLDLRTLADKVGVSPHQLSQYLNEQLKLNFYDFINQHRIAEAKRRLLTTNDAILDIALAVGFNNKATFNNAFKKYEQQTPSQFRKINQ